jgi:hypothetical protein
MTKQTKTQLKLKEYDEWDGSPGTSQCVHFDYHEIDDLSDRTIRRFLAEGDYSEGGDERYVEVYHGERLVATYTAPEIRRIAAALRGAAKRAGKTITTGC